MINEQKIWRTIGVLSLVLVSWIAFIFFKSIYAWAIIPAFAAIAMMIGNPRGMLWWGLGWFMVTQYLSAEMRVGFLGYLDEVITLGMLGILLFEPRRKTPVWDSRKSVLQPYPRIVFFFVLLTLFSAVVNKSVDIYLLMWCFQYLRMFVILFFAAKYVYAKDAEVFVKFVASFSILQFILNFGWKFHINPLPNSREFWPSDYAVGTLNGCDLVAYFSVMVIVLLLAVALEPPSKKMQLMAWIGLMITSVNFMFTNTTHAYFILIPAVAIFFLLNKKAVLNIISGPALVGLACLLAVFLGLFSMTDAGTALKPEYLARRYDNFMNGAKIESYRRNATQLPAESPLFWWVGHGPAQAGSAVASALRRPIGDKYFNVVRNEERYRMESLEGSITSGPQTGILTYWSELGPFGLLMITLTYVVAFHKSRKALLRADCTDKYQLAIIRSLPSILVVVLLVSLLRDLLYMAWWIGLVWVWIVLSILPLDKTEQGN